MVGAQPAQAEATGTFTTTDGAVAIPDGVSGGAGPAVSQDVQVSGAVGRISHLEVGVTLTHPFAQDVILTVTAPDGTTAYLARNTTAGNVVLDGRYNFTDTATQRWDDYDSETSGPPPGDYLATDNGPGPIPTDTVVVDLDTAFGGKKANGTWTITARDLFEGDTGTLTESDLTITTDDTACNDATLAERAAEVSFADARSDVSSAKKKLREARKSGNRQRIEKAKNRLTKAKAARSEAAEVLDAAQARVDENC